MKKHTGLIIGLIAAIIVLGGGAMTYVFAGEYIANKFALITKSDDEYFRWLSNKQIKRMTKALEKSEKDGEVSEAKEMLQSLDSKAEIKIRIEDDFCDKVNIYPIKDIAINVHESINDGTIAASIVPKYGANTLLTMNFVSDTKQEKLYVQIPEYNEGVVEVNSLIKEELESSEAAKKYSEDLFGGMDVVKNLEERDITASEIVDKYAHFLLDSVKDVSVNKKATRTVGDKEKKLTAVTVKLSADDLKAQLKGIVEMLYVDGIITESEIKSTLDKAIDELDPTVSGEMTEYLNGKGRPEAFDFSVFVDATKVEVQLDYDGKAADHSACIKINVNSLNALTIDTGLKYDIKSRGLDMHVKAVPGTVVTKLIGDKLKPSFEFSVSMKDKESVIVYTLKDDDKEAITVEMNTVSADYEAPAFSVDGKKLYEGKDVLSSDYVSLSGLAKFALGIIDAIDEDYVDNAVNELLESLLGEGFTMDTIRQYIDMGLLDMFGNPFASESSSDSSLGAADYSQGGTKNTEDEDVSDETQSTEAAEGSYKSASLPEGLVSVDPKDFVPSKTAYPQANGKYYYSHSELAGYCSLANYTGLTYTAPKQNEITPAMFEEAKEGFLRSFENLVSDDSPNKTVDWGDEIYADIVLVNNGVTVDMFSFPNSYAAIGEYMYGDGLDDKLIGMKIGESRDVEATLGADYGAFAGQTGTFRVTIKEIDRYLKPEWTESFICDGLGYDSLDACSDEIMSRLQEDDASSPSNIAYTLTCDVKAASKIAAIPDDVYMSIYQEYYNNIYNITCGYGMRPEEYFTSIGYTDQEFADMLDEDVDDLIANDAFYSAIATKEGIYLTGTELISIINDYLEYYEADSFEDLMEYTSLESIINYEIENRIEALIYSKAIIK